MRRPIAIVVLALGGMLVGTSTAQAPVTETIVVKEDVVHFRSKFVEETAPHRLNPGDVVLISARLFDVTTGDRVGLERETCTVHFGKIKNNHNELCIDEITLRGRGRLEAQGVLPGNLAIVGGINEFNDVAGTVHHGHQPADPNVTINLVVH